MNIMGKWIKIKDERPKEGQRIISCRDKFVVVGEYSGTTSLYRFDFVKLITDFTHWMPCPDAPFSDDLESFSADEAG